MQHPLAGGDGGGQGARGQGQDWPPHSNWQRCRDCSDGKSPEIQEDTARHPSVRGEETLALIEIQITNIKRREQSGMKAWLWRMVNIRKLNFPFLLYKNIKPTLVQIKWGRELEVGKWRRGVASHYIVLPHSELNRPESTSFEISKNLSLCQWKNDISLGKAGRVRCIWDK